MTKRALDAGGNRLLQGLTIEYVKEQTVKFVRDGTVKVVQVREQRPAYGHREFYYKVIFPEPGFTHGVFVEMELTDDDQDCPAVTIFNAHAQVS